MFPAKCEPELVLDGEFMHHVFMINLHLLLPFVLSGTAILPEKTMVTPSRWTSKSSILWCNKALGQINRFPGHVVLWVSVHPFYFPETACLHVYKGRSLTLLVFLFKQGPHLLNVGSGFRKTTDVEATLTSVGKTKDKMSSRSCRLDAKSFGNMDMHDEESTRVRHLELLWEEKGEEAKVEKKNVWPFWSEMFVKRL